MSISKNWGILFEKSRNTSTANCACDSSPRLSHDLLFWNHYQPDMFCQMTPTCDPKPGEHEPLAHQGKYVTPMCLGIFWSVEEWLEMASNETVMLILRSSPNLVDILGDTYFDFITFYFLELVAPRFLDFQAPGFQNWWIPGFSDFQIKGCQPEIFGARLWSTKLLRPKELGQHGENPIKQGLLGNHEEDDKSRPILNFPCNCKAMPSTQSSFLDHGTLHSKNGCIKRHQHMTPNRVTRAN